MYTNYILLRTKKKKQYELFREFLAEEMKSHSYKITFENN